MDYGFWSDGTPCGAQSVYINKYFAGREFRHKQIGHVVIHGYGEYIEGQDNMFAITAERGARRVLVTLEEFLSDEMLRQIDPLNRLRFTRFFIQSLADSQKCYKSDRDMYLRSLKLGQESTIHSSTE